MPRNSKAMAGDDAKSFSSSMVTSTSPPFILLIVIDLGRYMIDREASTDARYIEAMMDSLKYASRPIINGIEAAEILEESSKLLSISKAMERHADSVRVAVR